MSVVTTRSDRRVGRRNAMAPLAVSASALYLAAAILLNRDVDSYRIDLSRVGGLDDVLAALALALLCGAIGWVALGRRIGAASPLALLATCVVVGVWVVGTALLIIGWLGLLNPATLIVVLLLGAMISWRRAQGWLSLVGRAAARLRRLATGWAGRTWAVVITTGVVLLFLIAFGPPTDYDTLMYHLDLPIEFLEEGRLFVPEDNRHFSYLAPVHMLYLFPLAAGMHHAVFAFSVVAFVLLLLALIGVGRRLGGVAGARTVSLLGLVFTSLPLVAVDAKVEVWAACLVALTLYWGFAAWGSPSRWKLVALCVTAAAAVAVKLTTAPIAAAVVVVVVVGIVYRSRAQSRLVLFPISVALVVAVPWFAKNIIAFGDPVFPLLGGRGPAPWLISLGATGVPGVGGILGSARDSFDFLTWIASPERLTLEPTGYLQGLPLLVALGWLPILLIQVARRREVMALILLAVAQIAVVVGVRSETNLRYLIPAGVVLIVASGIGLAEVTRRSKRGQQILAVALAVSMVWTSSWMIRSLSDGYLDVLLSGEPAESWIDRRGTGALSDLDQQLEAEGAELAILLFEARAAGFRTPVLQDNVDQTWQAMTTLPLSECPSLGDATHLVVNESHLAYFVSRGVNLDDVLWSEFAPYAETCLDFTSQVGPFAVYEVR